MFLGVCVCVCHYLSSEYFGCFLTFISSNVIKKWRPLPLPTRDSFSGFHQTWVKTAKTNRFLFGEARWHPASYTHSGWVSEVKSVASSAWLGWWNKERTGEAFAHRVGDRWGVGNAGCDNGAWGKTEEMGRFGMERCWQNMGKNYV